jgi:hypothetical protein
MKQEKKLIRPIFESKDSGLADTLYYFAWTGQGTVEAFEEITKFIQTHARLIYKRVDLVYLKIERAPLKEGDEA